MILNHGAKPIVGMEDGGLLPPLMWSCDTDIEGPVLEET